MVAYMQDSFSAFHNVLICMHRLLWSLLFVAAWYEFQLQYHDFMIIGDLGADGERFHALGAWNVVTR